MAICRTAFVFSKSVSTALSSLPSQVWPDLSSTRRPWNANASPTTPSRSHKVSDGSAKWQCISEICLGFQATRHGGNALGYMPKYTPLFEIESVLSKGRSSSESTSCSQLSISSFEQRRLRLAVGTGDDMVKWRYMPMRQDSTIFRTIAIFLAGLTSLLGGTGGNDRAESRGGLREEGDGRREVVSRSGAKGRVDSLQAASSCCVHSFVKCTTT